MKYPCCQQMMDHEMALFTYSNYILFIRLNNFRKINQIDCHRIFVY